MPAYSKKTIRHYFAQADAATTNHEKGKALEDLVCYLFEKVPGVSITQRNVKNAFDTEEIDVALFNEQHAEGLKFLSNFLLVECKNWSGTVGSVEVAWFATKIENRSLDFGILIAANGITGSADDRKQAHDVASKALMKGIRLVVITREEIEAVKASKDLVALIKTKICQLIVSGDGVAVMVARLTQVQQLTPSSWNRKSWCNAAVIRTVRTPTERHQGCHFET